MRQEEVVDMKIRTLFITMFLSILCAILAQSCVEAPKELKVKHRKIALHSYVYHKCATIEDVIEQAQSLGADAVVLSQTIKFKKYPDVKISPNINDEQKAYLKKLFDDAKLEIASFGIGTGFKKPKDADKYFSFCKEMGIKIFSWEGNYKDLPSLNKKAAQYGVKLAVHHHTASYNKENLYNTPEGMLMRIKDFDNVYALVDNGHWAREKTDQIRGYKTLNKKIIMLHFKDPKQIGALEKTDAPIGEGALNIPALLATLDSIGFDGYFVLENECVFDNPTEAMKKSINYLRTH